MHIIVITNIMHDYALNDVIHFKYWFSFTYCLWPHVTHKKTIVVSYISIHFTIVTNYCIFAICWNVVKITPYCVCNLMIALSKHYTILGFNSMVCYNTLFIVTHNYLNWIFVLQCLNSNRTVTIALNAS